MGSLSFPFFGSITLTPCVFYLAGLTVLNCFEMAYTVIIAAMDWGYHVRNFNHPPQFFSTIPAGTSTAFKILITYTTKYSIRPVDNSIHLVEASIR